MKEEKKASKVIQTTIDDYYDQINEETFMWHFTQYFDCMLGKIAKKNRTAVAFLGFSLLNTINRAYAVTNRYLPGNFFLVLRGSPAAGKSSLLKAFKIILDGTWVEIIPTGSAEAIEQEIELRRFGYLIWDEISELSRRGAEYLDRVADLLKRAYYLDRITRYKTTKKSIDVPMDSYYLSVILSGLQEDWVKLEKKHLGGFERRFLPITIEKARKPFEVEELDPDAQKHLEWLWNYANERKDICVLAKMPDLSFLQEKVEKVDEQYSATVEEYTYKITTALMINENINVSMYQRVSNQKNITLIHDDTIDTYMIRIDTLIHNLGGEAVFHSCINTLFDTLIHEFNVTRHVADETIHRLLDRIDSYLSAHNPPILRKRKFMREVLKITNAQYFSYVVKALVESGHIRIIRQSERSQWVVLDPAARCCCNCAHWDQKHNVCKLELPTDASAAAFAKPINPEELVKEAKECDDFVLAEQ